MVVCGRCRAPLHPQRDKTEPCRGCGKGICLHCIASPENILSDLCLACYPPLLSLIDEIAYRAGARRQCHACGVYQFAYWKRGEVCRECMHPFGVCFGPALCKADQATTTTTTGPLRPTLWKQVQIQMGEEKRPCHVVGCQNPTYFYDKHFMCAYHRDTKEQGRVCHLCKTYYYEFALAVGEPCVSCRHPMNICDVCGDITSPTNATFCREHDSVSCVVSSCVEYRPDPAPPLCSDHRKQDRVCCWLCKRICRDPVLSRSFSCGECWGFSHILWMWMRRGFPRELVNYIFSLIKK